MWVLVFQRIQQADDKALTVSVQNLVNVDLVERVHPMGTGLTLHLQSGQMIEVDGTMDWWKSLVHRVEVINQP
jgi:hypothetical protein